MGLISRVSSRTYRNTLLLTFSPPSPALPQAKTKSPRSSNLLAPTSKPTNSTKSSPNWTGKTLKTSSPKAWVSSPLFHLVVLPQLVVPLPPVMPLQLLKRRKNPPKKKNPTPIWDSIFLDKKKRKKRKTTTTAEIKKTKFYYSFHLIKLISF